MAASTCCSTSGQIAACTCALYMSVAGTRPFTDVSYHLHPGPPCLVSLAVSLIRIAHPLLPTRYPTMSHNEGFWTHCAAASPECALLSRVNASDVCAFGFEANPHFARRLGALGRAYRQLGWRARWYVPAAAWVEPTRLEFLFEPKGARLGGGLASGTCISTCIRTCWTGLHQTPGHETCIRSTGAVPQLAAQQARGRCRPGRLRTR